MQYQPKNTNRLYIGNLSQQTTEDSLLSAFKGMRYDVKNVQVLYNEQGKSKGAAYVYMNSDGDAMQAVADCQKK